MGNCWAHCWGLLGESSRLQRGGGSKYFRSSTTGQHYTIEFENLVESEEAESPASSPRAISEEELAYLREHRYAAISDKQGVIDEKLQTELWAQEESLRVQEESEYRAQREAARAARLHTLGEPPRVRVKADVRSHGELYKPMPMGEEGDACVSNARATFRSSRVSSETNVATPNTESSYDFTSKTRSTNDDGTSLDLEWEDEEGMNRMGQVRERSRTEEDILRAAALRQVGTRPGSGPASEDSTALEWENDFVSAHAEDSEGDIFSNPLLDSPPGAHR